jgi:hypothetical protein
MPTKSKPATTFAGVLEQIRLQGDLSPAGLARWLDESETNVSRWRRGQRPEALKAHRVARRAGLDHRWLEALAGYDACPVGDVNAGAELATDLDEPDAISLATRMAEAQMRQALEDYPEDKRAAVIRSALAKAVDIVHLLTQFHSLEPAPPPVRAPTHQLSRAPAHGRIGSAHDDPEETGTRRSLPPCNRLLAPAS